MELEEAPGKLRVGQAAGYDKIVPKMLKYLGGEGTEEITRAHQLHQHGPLERYIGNEETIEACLYYA